MMNQDKYVRIFDTSMRDGEQSPGATMTSDEKLELARALARLGVDVMEAGFPAASSDDLFAVKRVASIIGTGDCELHPSGRIPIICGLARAAKNDIDKAWEAVSPAKRPRIHTFLATSPIHREFKLRMSRVEVLAKIREMVAYARTLCDDIEFSPEDAGRTEPEFLYEALAAAIEAGATTLNIPDTVGYTVPEEFGALIAGIVKHVPNVEKTIISVHCHNDLGLATANTLAGLRNGARQAEVTINGIGERAGNTALEEVVMALRTRHAHYGLETGIETTHIARVSRLVSQVTGMRVQSNKAIVGANAFAHEAGIHQDGMLKHQDTYEIMRPEVVGVLESSLVLGKHSGRHAFAVHLANLGIHLEGEELARAFIDFKALTDKKKYVTDADLEALVSAERFRDDEYYQLEELQVSCGTRGLSTATVRLRTPSGQSQVAAVHGTGPVHACYKAIDQIVGPEHAGVLMEFEVHACTQGIDALGEVSVKIGGENSARKNPQDDEPREGVFHGQGADTDIILASVRAYLGALNRRLAFTEKQASRARAAQATPVAAAEIRA
jgi:2-isopropylmalate synthase